MAPKFEVRKSEDRGHADHGWLDSYHTFSFADYYHPKFNSFGSLRVLNEDRVEVGEGFPTHRHTEYNASEKEPVHFLQIWNKPDTTRVPPSYQTGHYPDACKKNRFALLIAPGRIRDSMPPPTDGAHKPLAINSDFYMSAGLFDPGTEVVYTTPAPESESSASPRRLYLHLVNNNPKARVAISSDGSAISGVELKQGDGCFVREFEGAKNGLKVSNVGDGVAELVLMDLA
ncbi:hypothetical protein HDU93_009088 [Gonapodya sp. JEL0774]|nr:hypothetical protein HDU93_009088 [Gonapodya sp. JEL0774]